MTATLHSVACPTVCQARCRQCVVVHRAAGRQGLLTVTPTPAVQNSSQPVHSSFAFLSCCFLILLLSHPAAALCSFSAPLWYDAEQLQELSGTTLAAATRARRSALERQWERLESAVTDMLQLVRTQRQHVVFLLWRRFWPLLMLAAVGLNISSSSNSSSSGSSSSSSLCFPMHGVVL